MIRFGSLRALVEFVAARAHLANLERGGVFDANGDRTSDIELERRVAFRRLVWVSTHYAAVIVGLTEPSRCGFWYIRDRGFTPAAHAGPPTMDDLTPGAGSSDPGARA